MDLKAQGRWEQVKGRIKESWGVLTDDDLDRTEGKFDRVVGVVKEKTGEALDTVEDKLRQILDRVDQRS